MQCSSEENNARVYLLKDAEKRALIYITARSGLQSELQIPASVCNAPACAEPFRQLPSDQARDWRSDPEDGRWQLALVIALSRGYDRSVSSLIEIERILVARQVGCAPPTASYRDFAAATGSRASHVCRQALAGVASQALHVRMR